MTSTILRSLALPLALLCSGQSSAPRTPPTSPLAARDGSHDFDFLIGELESSRQALAGTAQRVDQVGRIRGKIHSPQRPREQRELRGLRGLES